MQPSIQPDLQLEAFLYEHTDAEIDVEIDRSIVREGGLYAFGRLTFPQREGRPLIESPHLKVLCRHLEQVSANEITRLLVNVPPGTGKSTWLCVLFPAWDWIKNPWRRWMFASFDDSLVLRDARRTRALVESEWYQTRWGPGVGSELGCAIDGTRSAAAKAGEYWTTDGGLRFSTTIGAKGTGWHSHIQVIDDPHKAQDAMMATTKALEDVSVWYDEVMSSRRLPGAPFARIVDMQRLADKDLSSHCLAKGNYHHLCLPMIYRSDHPYLDEDDHRQAEGELLCPLLKDVAVVEEEARELGPRAQAAQHDQVPVITGGAILRAEYMVHRWKSLPPELHRAIETGRPDPDQQWLIAGDLTFKSRRQSRSRKGPDWVVYQLWCAWRSKRYLIDQIRGQWGYREAKLQLALFAIRHLIATKIILEDAANAPALEDDLTEGGLWETSLLKALEVEGVAAPTTWGPSVILEPHGGGVMARVWAVEEVWASGSVNLPTDQQWVDGPQGFIDEHLRYTGMEGATDDQVSCSSLALLHLKTHGALPAWARAHQPENDRDDDSRSDYESGSSDYRW